MAINDTQEEKKIQQWLDNITNEGNDIDAIKTISEVHKSDNSLLFAFLEVSAQTPEGTPLPRYVFIRGHACIIVPLLRNRKTNEELFLMVNQRRVGNGKMCLEFPAGMLDDNNENPHGIALKELQEETGLSINDKELFKLNDKPLYSSVGASDEAVYFFGCIKEVDDELFNSFRGKKCGNSHENEFITVELVTSDDIFARATSLQVMVGLYFFNRYRKQICYSL